MRFLNHGKPWTKDSGIKTIDANLGIDGLPQSGTGQASLFTGINCAELAGRHYGPYPHSKTKDAIKSHNIFQRLLDIGVSRNALCFANAYPDRFFKFVEKTGRWTVTTLCCKESGVRLRRNADLEKDQALTADITGRGWQKFNKIQIVSEEEAGERLASLAHKYRFTLFEYYLTDKAGHSMDMNRGLDVCRSIDRFLAGILENMSPDDLLIISSDHGNLEDMSIKTHTRNPVPLLIHGCGAEIFLETESILDLAPLIIDLMS